MEKTIVTYVTEALMSSKSQLNRLDELFDPINKFRLGDRIFPLVETINMRLLSGGIHLEPCHCLLMDIRKVCSDIESKNLMLTLLEEFFDTFSSYCITKELNSQVNEICESNSEQITSHKNNSTTEHSIRHDNNYSITSLNLIIDNNVMSMDDNDKMNTASRDSEDKGSINYEWKIGLKNCIENVKKFMGFDYQEECKCYEEKICRCFLQCLELGLLHLESNQQLMDPSELQLEFFTNALENLANKECTVTDNKLSFFTSDILISCDGHINPMAQVLATTFRSILEAKKMNTYENTMNIDQNCSNQDIIIV